MTDLIEWGSSINGMTCMQSNHSYHITQGATVLSTNFEIFQIYFLISFLWIRKGVLIQKTCYPKKTFQLFSHFKGGILQGGIKIKVWFICQPICKMILFNNDCLKVFFNRKWICVTTHGYKLKPLFSFSGCMSVNLLIQSIFRNFQLGLWLLRGQSTSFQLLAVWESFFWTFK